MNILSQEAFTKGLNLIELTYGDELPVFQEPEIYQIWFDYFKNKVSDTRFLAAIKYFVSEHIYPPRVPGQILKAWKESGEDKLYTQKENTLELPSSEIKASQLTVKQMEENYLRMNLIIKLTMGKASQIGKKNKDILIDKMIRMNIEELKTFVKNY